MALHQINQCYHQLSGSKKHARNYLTGLFVIVLSACSNPAPKNFDNSAPAWYKEALIYNLDVKTFKDSDGDGYGDFKGLTGKLDYLTSLGINTVWLAPFQPSPWEDDGYDVTDYTKIDPRVGTMTDFKTFMASAKAKHIRIIMDMVLNHSSSHHAWFLASKDSSNLKHDWYLWSKKRPHDWDKGMGFPGVEKETWRYDNTAKSYYFHRFYRFEPDLNFQNPQIMLEAEKIVAYWLDLGMDGFRFDAVPFMIDDPRKSSENPAHDFKLLHQLAKFIKDRKPQAVILGEANIKPKENKEYFSKNNDGLDMMLNFEVNEYTFYALATGDAEPLKKALEITGEKPPAAQWVMFLRNHDEVDLGKLSGHQRSQVFGEMGPDTNLQLYKRGLRSRLAPMLHNNPKRLLLAYSLLYALPGTPILRYGEEIGMGNAAKLKEREAIRTPMQWDSSKNAGFSTAPKPFRPLIDTGTFSYKKISVSSEEHVPLSLLNNIRFLAALRKQYEIIGEGRWQLLHTSDNTVALLSGKGNRQLLMVFNFSDKPVSAKVKTNIRTKAGKELLTGREEYLYADDSGLKIDLEPYQAKWILLN